MQFDSKLADNCFNIQNIQSQFSTVLLSRVYNLNSQLRFFLSKGKHNLGVYCPTGVAQIKLAR